MNAGLKIVIGIAAIIAAGAIIPMYRFWSMTVPAAKEAIKGISYEDDPADVWQSPATTVQRGKGDCEDLAILIGERYRRDGIDFAFAVLETTDSQHMVVLLGSYYIDSVWPYLRRIRDWDKVIAVLTWDEVVPHMN